MTSEKKTLRTHTTSEMQAMRGELTRERRLLNSYLRRLHVEQEKKDKLRAVIAQALKWFDEHKPQGGGITREALREALK